MENDLISRSKALDLVCTKWREHTEPTKRYELLAEALEEIVIGLKEMPSAESEIIRCKECKWFCDIGCAIMITDDSDKPTENDYCSFGERRQRGQVIRGGEV